MCAGSSEPAVSIEAALGEELPRLRAFLVGLSGRAEEAEDLLQDVAERALRYAGAFDPARGALGAWLHRIAFRVFLDARRRETQQPGRLGEGDVAVADPVANGERGARAALARAEELERWLAPLTVVEREAILRFHVHDESLRDVAVALDLPLGTVKSHLHRARRKLGRMSRADAREQER